MLQHKLVNHFWKESLPRIVATLGILVGGVVKKCKTLLQSSTFDKSEGVEHFWKESLPKIVAKVGVLVGSVMKK